MFLFHNSLLSAKHKGKITDAVYHEYVKKTEEWEKRLLAFDNKHKHLTTADPRVEEVFIINGKKIEKKVYI